MLVTDHYSYDLMGHFAPPGSRVICFPMGGVTESQQFAKQILAEYHPSLLMSIERCGLSRQDRYVNCRGEDISATNARLDELFVSEIPSIGIGDGGNEIGMGNLAEQISRTPGLPDEPAVTRVSDLIIASVSNWGCYGLLAALSEQVGTDLLPDPEEETRLVEAMVSYGACDGTQLKRVNSVDGFPLSVTEDIIKDLKALVRRNDKRE